MSEVRQTSHIILSEPPCGSLFGSPGDEVEGLGGELKVAQRWWQQLDVTLDRSGQ